MVVLGNPSSQEAEAGESQVQGNLGYMVKLSQKRKMFSS
jgi:hypothetical protein